MSREIALLLGLALVCSIILIGASSVNAASKEQKAIDKAISNAASWKSICDVSITTGFNQTLRPVFHKDVSRCNGVIPTPPPNPPPNPPPPVPTGETTKVCLVGDLSGTSVTNKMNSCNLKIGLGDLGYKSDLSWFKSLNFNKCVIGNHDAKEDGSSSIEAEALAYCGDHWSLTTANGTTLIIGLNTNGDVNTQVNFVKSLLLSNYKTIIIVSHKGGHVPPNSHHPAEAATLYKQIESLVGVKLFEVAGHNHIMSSAPSMNWYISGAGGKSHYSCGTDSTWTFCNNSNYGYLELTIDNNNGATTAKFIN